MNQITVNNPFGNAAPPQAINAVANAESERAIEEVKAAMVIAKHFPRNPLEAMERIINSCCRASLAEKALYVYSRGGQEISGPSIRLAEAIAQEWGNLQFGIRELSATNGSSTVEAFAWDVERNTRQTKVFQVGHSRYARGALKKLTDPRDIYEMVANQGARRLRACILGVIPGDVVEAAVNQCYVTQQANIDTSDEGIKKMLEVFESHFGVSQELIEKRIQRRVQSIQPAQMQSLLNIAQSIKDGMSKPSDWFEMDDNGTQTPKTSDLSKAAAKTAEAPSENSVENSEPEADWDSECLDICKAIADAGNSDELAKAAGRAQQLPEQYAAKCRNAYTMKMQREKEKAAAAAQSQEQAPEPSYQEEPATPSDNPYGIDEQEAADLFTPGAQQ